ncbi:hypothetical protein JAAARDRAFT_27583 [Jaapia argillacea MUCL 33604]|uniref:Uncharacterized protein n=1 Tax=Jaapia argillacea MUCL 33604 TaxID=933084 RepID=A0A067QK94_9AGAM|nr:hypothetical protein JAAARDRAFT_27583 [Jaapia argillacea MUCL 33604]
MRAHQTAQAVVEWNKSKPAIILTDRLVEQDFGREVEKLMSKGLDDEALKERVGWFDDDGHPSRTHRPSKGGESMDDVARRAFVQVMQVLQEHGVCLGEAPRRVHDERVSHRPCGEMELVEGVKHVVFVSHNLFLCELWEGMLSWNQPKHEWTKNSYKNATWYVLVWLAFLFAKIEGFWVGLGICCVGNEDRLGKAIKGFFQRRWVAFE